MKTKAIILLILVLFNCNSITAQVLEQDSLALVAFYNSTGGPNWNNNSGWLTDQVSTWYGVTVENNRVIKLIIYNNNIIGCIPLELGSLSVLKVLSLGNDVGLSGEIPLEIYQLSNLKILGFYNCSINGIISGEIGNLINLVEFTVRQTIISGPIPSEIGNLDSLMTLDLHDNQLTGSIPPELGNCPNLKKLSLNDNQLTGSIPPELAGLSNLTILSLQNNQLTGNIPENFSNFFINLDNTISLNVSNNNLEGNLPESWGSLGFLIDALDISWNNFTYIPPVNYNWLISFFHIEGNKLTFDHIESHYQSYLSGLYFFFYYYPQDYLLEEIDTVLVPGSSYCIYSGTGGEFTNYKWFKNGELILESPDADTLHLENISYADTGIYTCTANNSSIYFLNLYRRPVHIALDTGTQISHNYYQKKYPAIYPNPASEEIIVLLPFESEPFNLRIFNLEGKCVLKEQHTQVNNSEITVGIKGLNPGLYLYRLFNQSGIIKTGKIIIN